jgi:predicted NAD/FAD-binding protein
MPRNRTAWSAWNYIDDGSSATTASKKASLTFNLTGLSGYNDDEDGHILTTLNPSRPPDPAKVQGTYNYSHPFYDSNVLAKQEEMYTIQGKRNVWFAGAWMKYGFHEDGFTAGLEAAKAISPGIQLPFSIVDSKYSRGMSTGRLSWETQLLRFLIAAIQFLIISVTAAQGQFSKIWALLLVHFIRRDTQQGPI